MVTWYRYISFLQSQSVEEIDLLCNFKLSLHRFIWTRARRVFPRARGISLLLYMFLFYFIFFILTPSLKIESSSLKEWLESVDGWIIKTGKGDNFERPWKCILIVCMGFGSCFCFRFFFFSADTHYLGNREKTKLPAGRLAKMEILNTTTGKKQL